MGPVGPTGPVGPVVPVAPVVPMITFSHVRLLRTLFGYTVTANAAFWIPSPAI